ncbi:hypothetical protein F0562_030508 [Nyssa sinensis]|uniref:Uncharacterized protein n=1 Tax=Nyssa sinensis TaxID=561372 RepID=A0A5J5AWL8_9ASTE|nr:hypothetical protein F0562_030508 [Nyssa sinensis]
MGRQTVAVWQMLMIDAVRRHEFSMGKGSKNQDLSDYTEKAYIGYLSVVGPQMKTSRADEKDFQTNYKDNQVQTSWIEKPNWSKTKTMTSRQEEQSQAYEKISRVKHEDKQVGSYQRYTAKEKVSHGDYVEKGSGQVGVKDEFKKSSTIKIGNKSGYTEYYSEERVRKVSYGNNNSSRNYGSKKRLTHDDY